MKQVPTLSDGEFGLIQKFLIEESGLTFEKSKEKALRMALEERIRERRHKSYREYYNYLKFHPAGQVEMRELIDLVTVRETYFFRNRPHHEVLMNFVLPEIMKKKAYLPKKSVRVWSAGCSRGNEPYSIAITIMETIPPDEEWDISILGTDISKDALNHARSGIYAKRDVSHLPAGYLLKYFKKHGSRYALKKNVKELVRFEYHNLAKDPFSLEGMDDLDIIFCRNVTIYFDRATTGRVINNFYRCLNQDGYLFIGHSESLWRVTNKFEPVEFPHAFIYRKVSRPLDEKHMKPSMCVPEIDLEDFSAGGAKRAGAPEPVEAGYPPKKISREREKTPEGQTEPLYAEATRLFNEKRYEEAVSLFDKIIAIGERPTRAHFAKATILANQAKYAEAVSELEKIIETDNLYIEAYYLLGVLSYKTGDLKEAETQFRKVVYVDPEVELAYFNLGNIYLYQKRYGRADREFNNAIRLLEKKPREDHVRFCEDFTVDFLLRACKKNLREKNERDRGKER